MLTTVVAECDQLTLRPGNSVQTRLSAALSDDSFCDLNKAEIRYKSNNPSVVSVDENGKVTARGVGVALVFATVTLDGTSLSGAYPLKVMPDLDPQGITVNGKKIEGFDKEVKAYSYLLKSKATVPVVQASAAGKDITVDISQAEAIPGTAVVNFIDNSTLENNLYYINFGVQSAGDEFDGASIGDQWEWLRENKATHSLSKIPGSLTITTETGDVSEASGQCTQYLCCRVQIPIGPSKQNCGVQGSLPNLKMRESWPTRMTIIL